MTQASAEFREAFERLLGPPSPATDGVTMDWLASPLGPLVVGATDRGICLLEFGEPRRLETQVASVGRRLGPPHAGTHPLLEQLRTELAGYFARERRAFTVPLVYPGTAFQVKVWDALRRIPYGETRSYEQLAWEIGAPKGQRAVGHANGLNPLAIVIPCHRVVNKGGGLGGYGGGLWRKRMLLDLEDGGQTVLALPEHAQAAR